MKENLLAGKVSIAFYTKINTGLDELVSQTSMCGLLINSYYRLLYQPKLRDMSFEVLTFKILNLHIENSLNIYRNVTRCTATLGELVGSHTKVAIYPAYAIHCKRL